MMCPAKGFEVKSRVLAFILFLALATLPAPAQSVMLGWQRSPDPKAAGYNIYYGTTSHIYTSKVSVGNVTNTTISGLIIGNTYYFAATTYDSANQESGFSNEAMYANPTNAQPTLTVLNNVVVNENVSAQSIALNGISSGASNEHQTLTVTASSSNLNLIPNPAVTYTSPNTTGSITFTPVAKAFGTAIISVTVNDGGASNNIITRTFTVTVNHVNQLPTLTNLSNVVVNENAPAKTVTLVGISSGAANENQTLTVTASSSNLNLIPNPTVAYTSPNTTGSITFTPVAKTFGTATLSVTINDGGASNNIITRTFTVTVNHVNQPPTLNSLNSVTISENASTQSVALAGISSGAPNESQTLKITASSSNLNLIPNPSVTYASPNATGTVMFKPLAKAFGTALLSVTVNDGGASNNLITRTFTVTVQTDDKTKPSLSIVSPSAGQRWTDGTIAVKGTADDDTGVKNVFYSLNGDPWISATTSSNWKDWSGVLTMKPGNNTLRAYAVDTSGNLSTTNTVSSEYDLLMPLSVQAFGLGISNPGWGSFRPNYSGQTLLPVNESSTLMAQPSAGFAFANWMDGSGKLLTNSPTLQFIMTSNLTLRANFVDVTKPTLNIVAPISNQQCTNGTFTVIGSAGDNVALGTVYYSLNGSGWTAATTGNNWAKWTANVTLASGENTISAYAVDTSGNFSLTNAVTFEKTASASLAIAQSSTRAMVAPYQAVLAPAYFAGGQFALTISGATNVQCVLQASTNLLDWIPVQTNILPYTYLDTNAGQFSQRYYRTIGK